MAWAPGASQWDLRRWGRAGPAVGGLCWKIAPPLCKRIKRFIGALGFRPCGEASLTVVNPVARHPHERKSRCTRNGFFACVAERPSPSKIPLRDTLTSANPGAGETGFSTVRLAYPHRRKSRCKSEKDETKLSHVRHISSRTGARATTATLTAENPVADRARRLATGRCPRPREAASTARPHDARPRGGTDP